jgi:CRP/FNR family cyclic AMP-dependent transcriptional regulator
MSEILIPKSYITTEVAPLVHPQDLFPPLHFPITRSYQKGEVMFQEGNPAHALYLVQEGIAKEYMQSEDGEIYITALATRRNSVILGIEALDGEGIYGNTAEAVTPVIAQQMCLQDVREITKVNPDYSLALMRQLTQTIRRKRLKYTDMVFLDLKARLALNLLEIEDPLRDFAKNSDKLPEFSNLTQEDLADMIGGTRPHVCQLLGIWEDNGYLYKDGRRIIIQNVTALESIGANEAVIQPFPPVPNPSEAAQVHHRMYA